jgi:predicted DNA-binding transcriptional regulator YafY
MSRAARLFSLAQYLKVRGGRTLAEIEARFDVSGRTVFRDLAALEESGVPIAFEEGRYRVLDSRSPGMSFDSGEVALLRVALSNPALRTGGPLGRRLMSLIEKLETALRGGRQQVLPLASLAGPETTGAAGRAVMAELERLIAKGRAAAIRYESLSGNEVAERGVDPWRVFHRAGAWYLVGRCHVHDEPRLFRLDRIHGVKSGSERFKVPVDFDVERFLADAWNVFVGPERFEVRLRFAPSLAPLIDNASHHPGERKTRRADGSVDYTVTVAHLDEIARWIVGFGGDCRVLGPVQLKSRVRELATGVLATEWRTPAAARRKGG